jgi:hypothetical protein
MSRSSKKLKTGPLKLSKLLVQKDKEIAALRATIGASKHTLPESQTHAREGVVAVAPHKDVAKAVAKSVYHQIISPKFCDVHNSDTYIDTSVSLLRVARAAGVNKEVIKYTLALLMRSAFGQGLVCDMNDKFVNMSSSNSSYDFECRKFACIELSDSKGFFYLSCDQTTKEHSLNFALDRPDTELCLPSKPNSPNSMPMIPPVVVDLAIKAELCSDDNGNLVGAACTGGLNVGALPEDLL